MLRLLRRRRATRRPVREAAGVLAGRCTIRPTSSQTSAEGWSCCFITAQRRQALTEIQYGIARTREIDLLSREGFCLCLDSDRSARASILLTIHLLLTRLY